jgi:putative methionine-R-sulfoxide reductase with GAF domain
LSIAILAPCGSDLELSPGWPRRKTSQRRFFGVGIALEWELVSGRATSAHAGLATGEQEIVTDQKNKPVLDALTFEKLLEAAFVLQKHKRKMRDLEEIMESHSERLREKESSNQFPLPRSKASSEESSRFNSDYTLILAEIVEAQRQIQVRHLELDKAMAVVAEKVARITGASGAGIGLLDEKNVRYRAGAGAPALPLGTEVPLSAAVCAASIRTGQVVRSDDVNTEVLFDPEPCRQRGILSLLAVPIYHDGDIVGALELYFDSIHGYAEQDIHTSQLMAGLVTEAISRDSEPPADKSVVEERTTLQVAIEKVRPDLVALMEDLAAVTAKTNTSASSVATAKNPCWKCGSSVADEEQFCGKCGAPRVSDSEASGMQSKLASAWQRTGPENAANALTPSNRASAHGKIPHPFAMPEMAEAETDPLLAHSLAASAHGEATRSISLNANVDEDVDEDKDVAASEGKIVKSREGDLVWSSAARTRDFLESLAATRHPNALIRFWRSRKGDFYLAIAVILVLVVIRWGIWSNSSVAATGHGSAVAGTTSRNKQPAPDADLSTFDKLLISLGLAEAPEAPEYKGNPDTPVWIDLHTALYYCPGADLYGKTPKGRVSSQRDAQLDQFEPANRKPCD